MKPAFILAIFVISGICSFAQIRGATALNDPETPEGKTYAIVIGISNYKNLPPLQYADRDAQSFYDYLVSGIGMNIDSSDVSLFVNENANINNLGNGVSDVLQKDIKKGDKVIFYFAGHGDYDAKIMRDQSLLLLQGAPNGNYFQNVFSGDYISTSDLHIKFTSELIKKGAEVMLIIDACHSGGLNSLLAGGELGGIITANALNTIQSTVKLYSCQAKQYSLESSQFGGGRGLFSYVLMEGLYGLADSDNNKSVSMKELQRYLEDNVPVLALPNKQDPVVKAEDNTLEVCKVNEDYLIAYTIAKEKKLPFLLAANIKGNEATWMAAMSITQKELYENCKLQIENKNLNEAYLVYKQYELQDKTSEASILLRRNLSAALQEGAAIILTPMLEDVSKFDADLGDVAQARDYLDKAAELLGKEHFLYDKLQARKLYLKTLVVILKGEDKKRTKECIAYLEESVSLEPNAPYTYFSLSALYSTEGDNTAAAENLKKYLDLIPTSSWAHNNYAILLHDLKNYGEAEKEYKKAIELDPGYSTAHGNYGILLKDLKRNEEAETEYRKALEIDPDYANAHINYGILLDELNRHEESELHYKKAIELNPNDEIPHYNYAILLYELGRDEESEKEYKKVIQLNPNHINAHYNYGILLYKLARYKEAEKENKKVIQLNPNEVNAYYNCGLAIQAANRGGEAIAYYRECIALSPGIIQPYIRIANFYYDDIKQYDSSAVYFRKILDINQNDTSSLEKYAYSLLRLNKIPEAINAFTTETEQFPDHPWGYYNLCCVYSLQDDRDKALAYFDKALLKGMKLPEHWQIDTDLDNIRTLPEFKELILRHYTQDELDKYPSLFVVQKK